jgi:hypothetical protein
MSVFPRDKDLLVGGDQMQANANQQVTADAVYAEFYNEMRRDRDYELSASTWYTVILLGIAGVIVSAKFGDASQTSVLASLLKQNMSVQFILALLITLIGGAAVYSIRYMNLRYHELRKYTDTLEPSWKKFSPVKRPISPVQLTFFTLFTLIVGTNYLIFSPPEWLGIIAGAASFFVLYVLIFRLVR